MNFEISSPTIGQITEALSKAQGKIENALKDSKNPFFKSTYADLSSVMSVTRGPLSDHQLSFSSSIVQNEGMNFLICTLSHSSGEWFRSYMPLVHLKRIEVKDEKTREVVSVEYREDMQTLGASISYARRFCLSALCHVGVEENDGEETVDRGSGEVKPAPRTFTTISDAQKKYLSGMASGVSKEKVEELKEKYEIQSLMDIPPASFNDLLNDLKGAAKK